MRMIWIGVAALANTGLAYLMGWRQASRTAWNRGMADGWLLGFRSGRYHAERSVVDYIDELRGQR